MTAMNEFSRLTSLQNLAPIELASDLDIQQWLTDEGTRVLFVSAPQLPMFDIRLSVAAGSCRDGDQPGAAFLTISMLDEGATGLDAGQIAQAFEGTGALLQTHLGIDHATLSLRCLSEAAQRDSAVDTFARMVGQPSFPQASIPQVKGQCIDVLDAREQSPNYRLQRQIYQHLYAGHPYGYPRYGDRAGITALTREDLLAFHKQHYSAPNVSISLVGDLTLAEARAIAAKISARLPATPAVAPIEPPKRSEPEVLHVETDGGQLQVTLALPAILRQSPDYAALTVANDIFGAGVHSRLYKELRTRHGLSYSPGSFLVYGMADGQLAIHWQCAAQYNRASQDRVEAMLKEFIANGPTLEELTQAKQRILSSSPLRTATNQAILAQLATLNVFDLPLDTIKVFHREVRNLTLAAINTAIRRNLNVRQLLYTSIGPDIEQVPLPPVPDMAG
jgi:zinc protease